MGRSWIWTTVVGAAALASLSLASSGAAVQASRLACGVCEAIVDEVNQGIVETTLTHSVQTRFRVDEKKRVPYARTEHNLLEIMESESFIARFTKYGIVKPYTKTARQMKEAYGEAEKNAAGAAADATAAANAAETQAAPETPESPPMPVSATTTQGDDTAVPPPADDANAAAAAAATATPTGEAAAAAPATPAAPKFEPFRPTGSLPLSLLHNHFHLAASSLKSLSGLVGIDSSASITSEIRTAVHDFLEDHLDETMLLFHRDVPDLKKKLCVEITEACKPIIKRKKGEKEEVKKAAATEEQGQAVKDEL